MNVYVFPPAYYDPPINSFGDTVQVYVRFNETLLSGPALTPYGGDTGDVLNAEVSTGLGFADWADNVMKRLPDPLMPVRDKAGPAIMSARTINTSDLEVYMSEDLSESTLDQDDFSLEIAYQYGYSAPFSTVRESKPGCVFLSVAPLYWWPTQTGKIYYYYEGVNSGLYDLVNNVNHQTAEIAVTDHAASQFIINLAIPGGVYRGVPFQIEVIARDSHGNVDTNFPVKIDLSSNLSQNEIDLPDGQQVLHEGVGYFTLTSWKTTDNLRITVSVNADGYDRYFSTSDPIIVIDPTLDAPNRLTVMDEPGDQGGFIKLTWDYSLNNPGINQQPVIDYYEIFREKNGEVLFVGTVAAPDTNGTRMDSMRVKMHIGDNDSSRFWVRAVWDPNQGISAAAAVEADGYILMDNLQPVLLRSKGKPVAPAKRTADATIASVQIEKLTSGASMASGRAVDNIPPKKPARFTADKSGVTVRLHWPEVTEGINNSLELFGVQYQIFSHASKAYFDPEAEGELIITTKDTVFTFTGTERCKYFCVRAIDSDNESEITNRVGKYGFTLSKPSVVGQTIYNYLSLPLSNTGIGKASQVAAAVGGVNAVFKLDATTNRFSKVYIPGISGSRDDFEVPTGRPVLVALKNTAPEEWFYTGTVPEAGSVQFALNRDAIGKYNEITVPLNRPAITNALELANAIGGIRAIFKLEPTTNRFSKVYIPGVTGQAGNFSLQCGEPVLVNATNSSPSVWP